jgi:hypothetical protein
MLRKTAGFCWPTIEEKITKIQILSFHRNHYPEPIVDCDWYGPGSYQLSSLLGTIRSVGRAFHKEVWPSSGPSPDLEASSEGDEWPQSETTDLICRYITINYEIMGNTIITVDNRSHLPASLGGAVAWWQHRRHRQHLPHLSSEHRIKHQILFHDANNTYYSPKLLSVGIWDACRHDQ